MSTKAHTVPNFLLRGFASSTQVGRRDPSLWVGSIPNGGVIRRSAKKLSVVKGYYDGRGAFAEADAALETHLAKIENDAASAIRRMTSGASVPTEVWRLIAWQAARTPGWMEIVEQAANESWEGNVVEPPPVGFDRITDRPRPLCLEAPGSGQRREVIDANEFDELRRQGWKWVFRRDDVLEAVHMQAWYFQVRRFTRLSWTMLTAPIGNFFVIGDRGVSWIVDGYADTPPAALRDPRAQVVAPLTKEIALVGRHDKAPLQVTPRDVNRFTAFASADWIAGPSKEVVERALADIRNPLH